MDLKSVRRAAAGLLVAALAGCGTLSSAAAAPPRGGPDSTAEPVVVTLGDSVPAGTACACDPFPTTYAHTVHATSENLAVPGYTSADVLAPPRSPAYAPAWPKPTR